MELFKWEVYKIFNQKIIYLAFVAIILLSTGFTYYHRTEVEMDAYKEWTGVLTSDKIQQAKQEYEKLNEKMEEMESWKTKDWEMKGTLETIAYGQNIEMVVQRKREELASVRSKEARMQQGLLEEIDVSFFSYHKGPKNIVELTGLFGFAVIAVMLLIGLSTSFSNEYSTGVDSYIRSAKKGRSAVVWAKVMAALVYTIVVVVCWEIWMLLFYSMQFGLEGWQMAVQYYTFMFYSPYPFTFMEYHLIQFGMLLFGAIGFALLILCISIYNKNILFTFIISASFYILPFILYEILPWQWLQNTMLLSFVQVMKTEYLFSDWRAISLFDQPITYPILAIIIIAITSISCILIMQIKQKRGVGDSPSAL